jgi:hypothetical protein
VDVLFAFFTVIMQMKHQRNLIVVIYVKRKKHKEKTMTNFPPNTEAFAYRFNMRYKHRAYQNEGMCRIEMYKSDDQVLIIATELKNNPGPSVINAAEAVYEKLARVYSLNYEDTTLITLFSSESYDYWERGEKARYTLANVYEAGGKYRVGFTHTSEEYVKEIIAEHHRDGAPAEMTEIEDEVL